MQRTFETIKIGDRIWHRDEREPRTVKALARHQASGRIVAVRLSNGREIDDLSGLEWVPQKRDEVTVLTSLYAPYLGDRLSQVDARLQEQWAKPREERDWNIIKPLQSEQAAIKAALNYFAGDAQIESNGHWTDRVCSVKGVDGDIASVTEVGTGESAAKIRRLPLKCLRVLNRFDPNERRANAQRTGLKAGGMVQVNGYTARIASINGEWGYVIGDSIVGSYRLAEIESLTEETIAV